jgi:anti-sigma regulatory factor (Ser/Thr protein kinase)
MNAAGGSVGPYAAAYGTCAGHGAAGAGHTETRFHHETLLYSGAHGFLEGALPFIQGALAAGEPVLVAVGPEKIELLKLALGADADRVSFTDMRLLGHNPARIIPAWHRFLEDNASENRPVRGIGEPIWPGRSPAELSECQRHETLLNLAFAGGHAWSLLCPYDLDGLDGPVIEAARHSHPFITEDGVSRASDSCPHEHAIAAPFTGTLPPPPASAGELAFTGQELSALRRRLTEWASRFELGCERTEHLVLAVTELTSNSVRHGGGGGTLRMWREDEVLLVEVRDAGHIDEPLVGRTRPGLEQRAGRGLWLVNHLCDLVQIRSAPGGSAVRVHMRLA